MKIKKVIKLLKKVEYVTRVKHDTRGEQDRLTVWFAFNKDYCLHFYKKDKKDFWRILDVIISRGYENGYEVGEREGMRKGGNKTRKKAAFEIIEVDAAITKLDSVKQRLKEI